ncbi:pimeloyl-ACP methyl ester carboxylesterase [Nitrospirillum amazonense]|uniref:Pimeloyl-ACP methyl ester carboxylesterase n=1 Tax=Nitrospirillum amazonense TaxID=28077 RepID=A0A560FQA0_9PROT|nr:epoxide hydrolase family protein [Nitrospirillum amazonense]TWB23782.1 pimeloyl-ACP methyl ester carboxylesterase [Nitrospirillum amazonense]
MTGTIKPFHLSVPESVLVDLRERLSKTRWPERETVSDISQGPQLAKIQTLCEHWRTQYDWRACERLLNSLGQHKATIDGQELYFLHVRSPEPDALPLLMMHGWPGSVLEFRKVIGPLTDPAAHGEDPRRAFHIVAPAMPGFAFSGKPVSPGCGLPQIADLYIKLMAELGYTRWGMQGGDLGAGVADAIARKRPAGLLGTHLNFVMAMPTPEEIADASPEEKAMLGDAKIFWGDLSGYAKEQSTRPQTIGYSLADSPSGLAAWIYAMFQDTCATRGDAEASFSQDEMLDDIMLYWIPNTGASAARLYWELSKAGGPAGGQPKGPITVPTGFTMLEGEHVRISKRWAEKRYSDVIYFNGESDGGHFAALERPKVLVDDIRATFARLN